MLVCYVGVVLRFGDGCCVVGVSIMSCFLIGAGVAWFPGAVRPSPAARKQLAA